MSFIDDLKQWARGDDEDDDELEEFAPPRPVRKVE